MGIRKLILLRNRRFGKVSCLSILNLVFVLFVNVLVMYVILMVMFDHVYCFMLLGYCFFEV